MKKDTFKIIAKNVIDSEIDSLKKLNNITPRFEPKIHPIKRKPPIS